MINVLVVDDSTFIRRTISSSLESDPDIHVIGEAGDGCEAMELVDRLNPDVITMDLNMPNMDGLTAIRKIRQTHTTPILVFTSTSDRDGSKVLEALNAGAMDFISKQSGHSHNGREKIINKLRCRVLALARPDHPPIVKPSAQGIIVKKTPAITPVIRSEKSGFKVVVIGASTGGPVIIESILKQLSSDFPLPVFIVQHMPAEFTRAFADRLDNLCKLEVVEAGDGMRIKPGTVYLAPGGRQMEVAKNGSGNFVRITDHESSVNHKPCVDITFTSVASIYGGEVLAIVLTGMGSDGRRGAKVLKQLGATVWAQDQGTSVVFGMPMAVINNHLADKVLPGSDIGTRLARVQ